MKIDNFTSSQGKSLMIMFILGTSLILSGVTKAMEDTWISILIAMVMAIPLVFIYGKLSQFYPNMGLFDILQKIYGKFIGKLFIFLYTFYFFHLSSICIRNATEYVQVVSFPETPQYVTAIFIGFISVYAIYVGFSVLSTWAKIVFPITAIMAIATFILAIPQYNYSYIKPILYRGWKPVMDGAYSLLTFPFGDTVIFLVFLGYLDNIKDATKVYINSVLIGGFLLLIVAFRNILLVGFPLLSDIYFPSHYATSIINFRDYIQRIEIAISINVLLTSFIKIVVCLYASYIGVIKLFNLKKHKYLPLALYALAIIVSRLIFTSTMEMFKFVDIYEYYVIPFHFVIPILTFIIASIKKKKLQNT